MFKKISEAYAVLSNPKRRKKYDLWGETEDHGDDDDPFDEFMSEMDDLFGSGFPGFPGADFDEFDDFIKILEQDNEK